MDTPILDRVDESKRRILDRPITGVISKDRIWEQWYSEEAMHSELPKMNQKDYLYSCIGDAPDRVIINYRGLKEYTFREFTKMVDSYTRAFMAEKLDVGDVICTISLTTPEMYAIKYSATSIGLVTCNLNAFDVEVTDEGVNRLCRQIKNVKPKMIFTLDLFEDKVAEVLNQDIFSDIKKVLLPLDNSVSGLNKEKIGLALLRKRNIVLGKNIRRIQSLKSFLKHGKRITGEVLSVYEDGLPCNIAFTSGTTGINKAVLLSHDANNALAFQHKIANLGFRRDEKQLALVPPFLAFWDADIVHTILCLGGVNIIELELSYNKIPTYLIKHKPQLGVWSQYLWDSMLTLSNNDIKDIANSLREVIVGGERCEPNQQKSFYCKTGLIQMAGFGASEVNTAFSLTHQYCHKIGTAGIPLPFNNVKLLDASGNSVSYNQRGRLYITSPCLMNGYYGRDDLTQKALIKDEAGIVWYDTQDYAVVDRDGCLTVLDRWQSPVEITYKGKNESINLLDINEIILKNRNIKSSKLNAIDGKIFLYMVFDYTYVKDINKAKNDVLEMIKKTISEICWPNVIIIMPQLPRTPVGKVKYDKLGQISQELSKLISCEEKLVIKEAT